MKYPKKVPVRLGVNRSIVICSSGIGKSRPLAPKSKIWQNRGFGNPLGAKLTVGLFPPWCTSGLIYAAVLPAPGATPMLREYPLANPLP
jgi:hypothetical protein